MTSIRRLTSAVLAVHVTDIPTGDFGRAEGRWEAHLIEQAQVVTEEVMHGVQRLLCNQQGPGNGTVHLATCVQQP